MVNKLGNDAVTGKFGLGINPGINLGTQFLKLLLCNHQT
jgi:hypothetical protein